MASTDILKGLNPAQHAAVVAYNEPSLIIAGAGSGKTRVLTTRIAYMIAQGVQPHNILALTFTNKAAREMRERIEQMIGPSSRYLNMGTFHSIFARLLRENAELMGYPRTYTIYEPSDTKNLLSTIIKERNLADDKYKPAVILSRISMAKNNLITPGAYLANASLAAEDRAARIPEFGELYAEYCRRCKQNGAMDFDDLLLQTNILLRDHPEVLAAYQERFQYVLVDEYQDTNYAQYIIIRRLAQHHSRVCVVGDDAQSIYSFRGAKIENILSFQRDYPQAKVFKLEQNYRSTQTIVEAANSVINHNKNRLDKRCFSEAGLGEKIRILSTYTDREEADLISSDLRDRIRESGDEWGEAAILYRTNNQSRALEDALRRKGIPYKIYKGNSFYDHKEVKHMLAYLRLIINPRDDEAFRRIINVPARGIGDTTVDRIAAMATASGRSMWDTVDALIDATPADAAERAVIRKVTEFVGMIRSLAAERTEKEIYDFGMAVATRSGLLPSYRMQTTPEAASAVENIEELLNTMQEFNERCDAEIRAGLREEDERATLEEWMSGIMLMSDMDDEEENENGRVKLMTVHSSKGLEYKYIYIAGCEENLFPSQRSATPTEIEEERRLFYVAITRAKQLATLTCAEMRFVHGSMEFSRPSRFLSEIDPQYVDTELNLRSRPQPSDEGESAIDRLRRQYDVRYQQSGEREKLSTRPFQRFDVSKPKAQPTTPPPAQRDTTGMRRLQSSPVGTTTTQACAYAVGDRVEHARFGRGEVVRVEAMATDHKIVVRFEGEGEKTLIARLARLTKL